MDYDSGILIILFSETIDSTPKSLVDVTLVRLHNQSGVYDLAVHLNGSLVTASDQVEVTIKLTEQQRVAGIAISGTPGDGNAIILDADQNAFIDIAQNGIALTRNIVVTESKDFRHPNITSAKILLGTGQLILSADETIDVSPAELVNLSLLHIENITGDTEISLLDSKVIEGDGTEF